MGSRPIIELPLDKHYKIKLIASSQRLILASLHPIFDDASPIFGWAKRLRERFSILDITQLIIEAREANRLCVAQDGLFLSQVCA